MPLSNLSSGRIILEVGQDTKQRLFNHCRERGITLKEWFISQTNRILETQEDVLESPPHKYSAFICHAHEDKNRFVRPLAQQLGLLGHKVWFDEFELEVGDSLRKSVDQGLRSSRFGIVVFSRAFFLRNWPQYELNGLLAREMGGHKIILPVWYGVSQPEVLRFSPPLADKVALDSSRMAIEVIAQALSEAMSK